MLKSLASLLGKSLQNVNRGAIAAALLLEEADQALAAFLPDAAGTLKAKSFKDGVLKVVCQRAAFGEELRLRADEAVAAVNARLGTAAVKRIVVA